MKKSLRFGLAQFSIACLMTGFACATLAQQQQSTTIETTVDEDNAAIEEVIVTGSYIKGSPLDAPSPVQVIDRDGIEAQGASVIWDVIKNLEVNSGSITNPGSGDSSQTQGTANVNLRNLGENSTLTLINGRRQVSAALTTRSGGEFVDLNTIPLVMTDRVEVLTDGGSALYGSDAVAGVVNIIMRTDFEGLELYGSFQGVEAANSAYDKTASAIWGWASDGGDTHFVLSGEYFERDPVSVKYANYFDSNSQFTGLVGATPSSASSIVASAAGFGSNLNTNYINAAVTAQNIAEGGASTPVLTDPLCTSLNSTNGDPLFFGLLRNDLGENSGSCREDNSEWNYIAHGAERTSIAGAFNHSFSDSMEFYSFFQYSDSETQRADDGANNARGPTVYLAAPGSHTGFAGAVAGSHMELGHFAAAAGLTAPTAADITNAPNSLANGGLNVPFWSNVSTGWPRDQGNTNITRTKGAGIQLGLKGDFDINSKSYNYDVGYSLSNSSLEQDYKTFQRDRAELAVNGLGGPGCTPNGAADFDFSKLTTGFEGFGLYSPWFYYYPGLTQTFFPGFVLTTRESLSLALTSNNQGQGGCEFYNPFLTSLTDPTLANSQEMMDWMNPTIRRTDKRNKLGVIDAVVSGELFEMAGGTAQFAAGAQYRMQTNGSRANRLLDPGIPSAILSYDAGGVPDSYHYVSNNYECALCSFNYSHERNVKATFLELSLPFAADVETQVALRWEDYGGNIGSALTSKFAVSWRPIDTLLLRTSFSQSFRAPNIAIVEEGLEASGARFRDPLRNQAVRAGLLPTTNENAEPNFTYTLGEPAPGVGNETANTYNIGTIWTPAGALDGFSAQADFWFFDVQDRVLPEPPISAIQEELAAFNVAAQDPNNYVLNSTLPGSSPTPYAPCDPNALETTFGVNSPERLDCVVDPRTYVVEGIVRSLGSTRGALITTTLSAINAGTIKSNGVDLKLGYKWDTDYGRFGLGFDYTYVSRYELIDVPGLELGLLETGEFDAAGTTGDGNLVRSLPDNKGHVTFNWFQENHGVTLIGRYVGSYEDLAYDNTFQTGNDFIRSLLTREIDSYNSWDMQYNFSHVWSNDVSTRFTFGLLDMFNADLPYREAGSLNYDATVFDGRGRRIYARVLAQF